MTTDTTFTTDTTRTNLDQRTGGVSRRNLVAGLGVVAGASALFGSLPGVAVGAVAPSAAPRPEALGGAVAGLTYLGLDGHAFVPATGGKYCDDTSGAGAFNSPATLAAPLLVPTGSVIRQINIAYQGAPVIKIVKRPLTGPQTVTTHLGTALTAGGGPKTQTIDVSPAITIEAGATYSLRFEVIAGESIYGVTLGYQAPGQTFIPFVGVPRILDTRVGNGPKLGINEERTINLGFPGARSAVLNVTVTQTEGTSGWISVNAADIVYPGNSSVNWVGAGLDVANGVITAVDSASQIKIRGGGNRCHVIIDRIGWLI